MNQQNRDRHQHLPKHIGILMDGNGRWAQQRGLPRPFGHRAASRNIFPTLDACAERGVQAVTLYGFSTENWARPYEEVTAFLELVTSKIPWFAEEIRRRGFRMRHSGTEVRLSCEMLKQIRNGVELSGENTGMIVNVAFNYGGRDEIVRATRKIVEIGIAPDDVTEAQFESLLDTAGMPEMDFVIRTGGEQRLSNFCLWQSANAVFYVTSVYWPDFKVGDLREALEAFATASNCQIPVR